MSKSVLAFVTVSAFLVDLAFGAQLYDFDTKTQVQSSYDYIVVGCGISGLVVSNRLSEDSSVSVLCIEAGSADNYEPIIQDPVYVGADIGGAYDWKLATVPQTQLDGATRPMPQGKALGGGSILNAMCWNRGGKDDYDAWEALGNPGWDWEGLLPYFIKSETYTPVYSEEIARQYSINYDPKVHGTSGPVQVSYPKYFYPQSINLFAGLNYLGVPTEFDPNDGSSAGAAFVPTDIDPKNQTRSDARRTYYDPFRHRQNFHVVTGQHVARVLIDDVAGSDEVSNPTPGGNEHGDGSSTGNSDGFGFGPEGSTPPIAGQPRSRRRESSVSGLRITGVEFAPDASAPRQRISATREVIIAAGALHSVQLLELSGIGPASLLKSFDIPVAIDLPGVGNNLQDHCLVGTFYPYNNASYPSPAELTTNSTYNAEAEQEYKAQKTGPWTAGSPNALAFPPLPLISNRSASILKGAAGQDPSTYLVSGLDPSIIAGYTLQKKSLVQRLATKTVAAYEIINNNAGSLTVSVMHPFSRGTCSINSPDPFEPPIIDPRWLSNPADRQVLIEALLFNRRILATPSMLELQAAQFVPPIDADEDALNQVINNGIRTEFHPSGTCAMLPLEQGGVVDPHLRVWGTQNLRIVDASIFPMVPAAHLQAVVYGVAEKAADIIKSDNVGILPNHTEPSPSYSATISVSNSSATRLRLNSTSSVRSTATTFVNNTRLTISSGVSFTVINVSKSSSGVPGTTQSTANRVIKSTPTVISSNPSGLLESTLIVSQSLIPSLSAAVSFIKETQTITTVEVTDTTTRIVTRIPSVEVVKTVTATMSIETAAFGSRLFSSSAAQITSSSLAEIFNSVGLPSSIGNALIPILLVNDSADAAPQTPRERQEERQAVNNFLRWLLAFLDIN
ncbi:hypothetical protein MMC22_006619 [Lobaria immixta]|nr:hypothetical protein [Lobaria immixta]